MPEERVSKLLAAAGLASRRAADELIAAGRVTVDGRTIGLGERADPALVEIAVDGRRIPTPAAVIHLALHKPAGVTSTVADRHAESTVLDLVPAGLVPAGARIYPVGRLDRDSEGLLLLTNDGDWSNRVLHPRHGIEREYAVALDGPLGADQRVTLEGGIVLDDGVARLLGLRAQTRSETASLARLLESAPAAGLAWYRVTLGQGMRRQVRRMLAAVEAPVRRLVRVRMGTLRLDLPAGGVRQLTPAEVRRLGAGVSTAAAGPAVEPRAPAPPRRRHAGR